MPDPNSNLVDRIARRTALEAFDIESGPAVFEMPRGERTAGDAAVSVSRASIAIRFTSEPPLNIRKAGYDESHGRIAALDGTWAAPRVADARLSSARDRSFSTRELVIQKNAGEECAATRLIFAGAAWQGSEQLDCRRVVAAPLSNETVSHHDQRLAIVVEGDLEETTLEAIDRASAFVAGLDLELLRVDLFSATGEPIRSRHLRGFRRVGRGAHSPFSGIADEHRMQAWAALTTAIPRLKKEGVPIVEMINHIGSHNQVAEINTSAVLLLLATQTLAYHRVHGHEIGSGAASHRPELQRMNQDLNLSLTDADIDRFEKLRVELLDSGFFHKPGYDTGRPQKDIKFLRDVAHTIVFRLCGYSGPFYGAESFSVRVVAADVP